LQEYEQFKNYSAGIECFEKALTLNPMVSPVPYLSLANLYLEIHDYARALQVLNETTMTGRSAGEHAHISGDALYNLGRLQEARAAYLRALEILPEDARVRSKLGLTEVRLGLKKKGLIRLANALEAAPEVFEMHDRLIKAFLVMNRMEQAADAAERMAADLPNAATILRALSIRSHMKQWRAAEKIVDRGLELLPEDQQLLEAKRELQREMAVPAKGNRLLHHRPFGG
jgi:tetratricopeptide (TPR) repeat protein